MRQREGATLGEKVENYLEKLKSKNVSKLIIDSLSALTETCSELDFSAISLTRIGISSLSRLAILDILKPWL